MARLFLLASLCLFGSGLVLGEDTCVFTHLNRSLNPKSLDAGANYSGQLVGFDNELQCRDLCCSREDCHLALIQKLGDGFPQCFLVNCMKNGENVCVLEESDNSKAFLKTLTKTEGYCRAGKEVGLCRASMPRFYYDVTDQTCKRFVYGGCGGNQNNFKTQEECLNACNGVKASPAISTTEAPLPEMTTDDFAAKCKAEAEVGHCRASLPRYYYTNGECKRFRYGGCGGNQNNYLTEEECLKTCTVKVVDSGNTPDSDSYQAACVVPAEPGLCRASFLMYYFDPSTQSCQSFIYGGCKGNKNRYSTLEECMSNCAGRAGGFDEHGAHHRARWTPAFFLVATLAIMSVVLLFGLLLISIRRVKHQRLLLLDDKQELLPEECLPEEEECPHFSK
ncbi:kunitz-type protease inhibitor 2 [Silurus meridionalis]|uniref:Kunitz-type protease inhibitor 2-like n=1 Tax=Silurus meridionalis TaxID=175797 RepID=A0A8T0B3C7_SILME|nr:kunitz-type protease inhibitor 2 [Silurus meridionalis]KAF7699995.1 hypothetical protein HF521_002953 [Silurus meridionalis]